MYTSTIGSMIVSFTFWINLYNFKLFKISIKRFIEFILITFFAIWVAITINESIVYIIIFVVILLLLSIISRDFMINIFITGLSVLLFFIIDLAIEIILSIILKMSLKELMNMAKFELYIHFFSLPLNIFFSRILGVFIGKNILKIKNDNKSILTMDIVFNVLGLILSLYMSNFINLKYNMNFLYANLLILILLITCVFNLINIYKTIKNKEEKRLYKQRVNDLKGILDYAESMEKVCVETRKFKHDYENILSSINGYIDEGDMVGLKEFFYNNISPLRRVIKNINIENLKYIKTLSLKGLVVNKLLKAISLDIRVVVDLIEDIYVHNIKEVDLCRVIGILLDNSIEAAIESKEKKLKFGIIINKKSTIIIISNSYNKTNMLSISEIYKVGFSTKGKNRGIGLNNVLEILEKYNSVFLDTFIENDQFIQKIEIVELGDKLYD